MTNIESFFIYANVQNFNTNTHKGDMRLTNYLQEYSLKLFFDLNK